MTQQYICCETGEMALTFTKMEYFEQNAGFWRIKRLQNGRKDATDGKRSDRPATLRANSKAGKFC
jgi:hypothetical protein